MPPPWEVCYAYIVTKCSQCIKSTKLGGVTKAIRPVSKQLETIILRAMIEGNAKTTIRPTAEALSHADPTLFEMIRYIRHVLDRHDPSEIAHNAALIYLAMFTAFRDAKLLELDWVPSLSLDIGDREFEIVISQSATSQGISDKMDIERDSRSPSSASNLLAVSHQTRRPEKARNRRKNGSSKAFALLDTLIERVQKDDVRCDTTSTIPLIAFGDHDKVAGTEATQLQLSNWLIDELSRLDHLLVQADKMSVSINCCYWRIGFSYREFCKTSHVAPGASQHPRTSEKDAFAKFCATPSVTDCLTSISARARLQKRLQRARKFVLLVDVFGEQVLQWVPERSVSRLDLVRLSDLQKIVTGSIEQKRVQAIKDKFSGPLVNPTSAQ